MKSSRMWLGSSYTLVGTSWQVSWERMPGRSFMPTAQILLAIVCVCASHLVLKLACISASQLRLLHWKDSVGSVLPIIWWTHQPLTLQTGKCDLVIFGRLAELLEMWWSPSRLSLSLLTKLKPPAYSGSELMHNVHPPLSKNTSC